MTKTLHPTPCNDLLVLTEKVAALEAWRSSTEADLKEIHDVISQVKLLMSLSIGGGGLSILTLVLTLVLLVTGNNDMPRGALKGNTNALKHGLYARQFNLDQQAGLRKMDWDDFRHEEFVHRAVGAEIFKLLNKLLSHKTVSTEKLERLVNSLCNNTNSINTSARTHALLNESDNEIGDALSQAIDDAPFYEAKDVP